MELLLKTSATAIFAVIAGLLIKKSNPELSLLLSICTVVLILLAAIGVSDGLRTFRQTLKQIYGASEIYVSAIVKCLGIALITKIGSDLCKDASQSAIASALEISGTVCALTVLMPILMNLLNVIGGLN